ncbi:MAG: hypothetical protein M1169_10300 [Firmicutes bacterium]|nr:hypothetical protein [Bacillota bacterium]
MNCQLLALKSVQNPGESSVCSAAATLLLTMERQNIVLQPAGSKLLMLNIEKAYPCLAQITNLDLA